MNKKNTKLKFIDLFAGCGGFSEGFYKEGFKSLVHVDFDKSACLTLKERMKHYKYSEDEIENTVICGDLTKKEINKKIDNNITRDWLDKQQEKKDALEKEKYKMEIEKSQIEAAKQIAIAYASGTYITNNYSTSNYSTSYSSPYYTVRIYDTLIW